MLNVWVKHLPDLRLQKSRDVCLNCFLPFFIKVGSLQSEGTRIGLQITISAPLVIIPRHSRSVDMLVVNLGLLDIQNEFDILPLPQESGGMEAVFDIIELSLQSVQLSR